MIERLQIELKDIRNRFKIEPDIEDIIKLYEACKRCDAPFRQTNLALIGTPVVVGGVALWPLTIGASIWLDEYAFRWWGGSNKLMHWALVFAYVKGRENGTFTELTSEKEAYRKIRSTIMQFACHQAELDNAIEILIGSKEPVESKDTSDPDWERVVVELEVSSGITADVWLWGKSAAYTARAYLEHRRIINAVAGNETEMTDALDDALTALAIVKRNLWIKHNE